MAEGAASRGTDAGITRREAAEAIDDDMITFSIAPQNKGLPVPGIFDRSADAP
ncbi:hypothetical protein [Streptomyces goshikiensis]|uniref:hypothetical protein n=1 Tax=Streptomyces goshikiensis TaxID=1942 RepID=UPI0036DC590F